MTNNYRLQIGAKTRFLNFFRRLFTLEPFETALARKTEGSPVRSFWVRLMPPNYLYPKNSRREVSRGGINFTLDISDYMEHAVYFGYRDAAWDELFRLARDKETIIDVGVNIGATLLNFARLSPNARVIGFEPDSKNFRKAEANLKLNDFPNVEIVRKGLGAEAARVKLFKVNEDNEGMNRILGDDSRAENGFAFEEIEIVRLDDFAAENALETIDLLKIDVEGYELKVLRGAERVLREFSPVLFIELDDGYLKTQGDSAASLVSFLTRLGYAIERAGIKREVSANDDFTGCHFDIICKK